MRKTILALFVFILSILFISACAKHLHPVDEPDYGLDPATTTLKVLTPADGENIKPGTKYVIKYEVPSEIQKVTIALYKKNVFQSNVVESSLNKGEFEWTVPNDILNSVHYKLKICDADYPDYYYGYSENFYIKADW